MKSDLIYRLLIQDDNLSRFQNQIKLFKWTGSEELSRINISEYLAPFFVHKTSFDVQEMGKMKDILVVKPDIRMRELRETLEYPGSLLQMLYGYKDQIVNNNRNQSLL